MMAWTRVTRVGSGEQQGASWVCFHCRVDWIIGLSVKIIRDCPGGLVSSLTTDWRLKAAKLSSCGDQQGF